MQYLPLEVYIQLVEVSQTLYCTFSAGNQLLAEGLLSSSDPSGGFRGLTLGLFGVLLLSLGSNTGEMALGGVQFKLGNRISFFEGCRLEISGESGLKLDLSSRILMAGNASFRFKRNKSLLPTELGLESVFASWILMGGNFLALFKGGRSALELELSSVVLEMIDGVLSCSSISLPN